LAKFRGEFLCLPVAGIGFFAKHSIFGRTRARVLPGVLKRFSNLSAPV
jgi:hypothetical protein